MNHQLLVILAEKAVKAAVEAGSYVQSQRHKTLSCQHKASESSMASQIVTDVDIASQNIILEQLLPTCFEHDLALLTEEDISVEDQNTLGLSERADILEGRFSKAAFWCIDPLDGTLSFSRGEPGFSVSIALVDKSGKPLLGVVYDPVHSNVYHAISGAGSFKNGLPMNPAASSGTANTLFTDESFVRSHHYTSCLRSIFGVAPNITVGSGAVMQAIQALETPGACFFKLPKRAQGGGCLWDYAATSCIASELGVPPKHFSNDTLALNDPHTVYFNAKGIVFASSSDLLEQVRSWGAGKSQD